jgi:hypothetical protein
MSEFNFENARQDHLDLIAAVIREAQRPRTEGQYPIPSSDEVAEAVQKAKTEVMGRAVMFPLEVVLKIMARLSPPSRADFKAGWDRATYIIDRKGMANSGLRFEEEFEKHSHGQETPRL